MNIELKLKSALNVEEKISGTFRSSAGAKEFTRICGYVSTVRKNDLNTLDYIEKYLEALLCLKIVKIKKGTNTKDKKGTNTKRDTSKGKDKKGKK